jgi:hypothetical protein
MKPMAAIETPSDERLFVSWCEKVLLDVMTIGPFGSFETPDQYWVSTKRR